MVNTNLTTLFQTSLFSECEQFVAEYDLDMTELTDDALRWTQGMKLGRFNKTTIDLPNYLGNLVSQYKLSRTKVHVAAHRLDNDLTNWELAFAVRELQEVAEMLSQVKNTVKFKKGFKPGNGYHKKIKEMEDEIKNKELHFQALLKGKDEWETQARNGLKALEEANLRIRERDKFIEILTEEGERAVGKRFVDDAKHNYSKRVSEIALDGDNGEDGKSK